MLDMKNGFKKLPAKNHDEVGFLKGKGAVEFLGF